MRGWGWSATDVEVVVCGAVNRDCNMTSSVMSHPLMMVGGLLYIFVCVFVLLLARSYPKAVKLLRSYARFLEQVKNDPWSAAKYYA